jgi:hypothetical protein
MGEEAFFCFFALFLRCAKGLVLLALNVTLRVRQRRFWTLFPEYE